MERWRGPMETYEGNFVGGMAKHPEGLYVLYADAQRAVAEVRREHAYLPTVEATFHRGYEQGQRDEQARIRAELRRRYRQGDTLLDVIEDLDAGDAPSDAAMRIALNQTGQVAGAIDAGSES